MDSEMKDLCPSFGKVVAGGLTLECVVGELVDYLEDLLVETKIFLKFNALHFGISQVGYYGTVRGSDSFVGVNGDMKTTRVSNNCLGFVYGLNYGPKEIVRSPHFGIVS